MAVPWVDGDAALPPAPRRPLGRAAARRACPAERARNVAWLRLREGGPFDELDRDRALRRLDARRAVEARALRDRAHLRPHDPLPRAAARAGEWLLGDYRSSFSAGGAWEEDGELWAADGTLVAQSRQLAMIRGPR